MSRLDFVDSNRFKKYKLLYKRTNADIFIDNNWVYSSIIFKARNPEEAMIKARKFWEEGHFGTGSIKVKRII